ncbi:MAG: T9SS type A sorting domain-containing protein [Candidatus Cloacimonetes bacterium]|mgnify:CR=1 FL=1|nr:T9SS type A sorting domain-containing protein [Candidatus Cloacimonadota bacterium]
MKTKLIILILLLGLATLSAQQLSPYRNMVHSSRLSNGNIRMQWMDSLDLDLNLPTELWHSTNGGAWQLATSQEIDPWQQALVPYEFGNHLRWRLRTHASMFGQEFIYMHAPYLPTEEFPPSFEHVGLIGTDATGDSVTVYQPYLDFTNTWCAATENKLYSVMENAANSFPVMNSISSYNVYLTTITNPETVVDTLTYAMVHSFNIPGVIQPGLYKLRLNAQFIPSFERIGEIQSQVLGGKLYQACNFSDLYNDPDFGTWPNSLNGLLLTSLSMSVSINLQTFVPTFGLGDYSTLSGILFEDHIYQVHENTLPTIDNVFLANDSLTFDYFDAESDFPILMEAVLPTGEVLYPEPVGFYYGTQPTSFSLLLPSPATQITLRYADNDIDIVEEQYHFTSVSDPGQSPSALACTMQNPFKAGNIRLSGLKQGDVTVTVYDLRGRKLGLIYDGGASRGELDLSWDASVGGKALPNGMYLLRVTQPGNTLLKRFVITK